MRLSRAWLLIVLGVPVLAAVCSGVDAQPFDFFYETRYVGNDPTGPTQNDVCVLSVHEQQNTNLFSGLFADFSVFSGGTGTNLAAALDSDPSNGFPGVFHPTGALAIAKSLGGVDYLDVYSAVNASTNWSGLQDLISTPPPPVNWFFPAATTGQIQHLNIANGFLPFGGGAALQTDYLITAEFFAGQLYICAYSLTNAAGTPVQPFLVNSFPTGLGLSCIGMAISTGKALGGGARQFAEIVFVDSAMVVHNVTFDIVNNTFSVLDPAPPAGSFNVPWNLSGTGNTIAGIWMAQNHGNTHNVAISIPAITGPTLNAGAVAIMRDVNLIGAPPTTNQVYTGIGGGPISHIPRGDLVSSASPARSCLGLNGGIGNFPGPYGWYVVTPGRWIGATPWWRLDEIDGNGVSGGAHPFITFWYPVGYVSNGTPMAHPAVTGFLVQPTYRQGLVWVPMILGGATTWIAMIEGHNPPPSTWISLVAHTVATTNFTPLPPLPLAGQPWPCVNILADQKLNWVRDYLLYFAGY